MRLVKLLIGKLDQLREDLSLVILFARKYETSEIVDRKYEVGGNVDRNMKLVVMLIGL